MNKTTNYQLNQWERTDKVQMENFNADNAKIDAAIKAEADARAAGDAALQASMNSKADKTALTALTQTVAAKGNCQIITGSYTGNGNYGSGNKNTLVFPSEPIFVCICGMYSMFALYGCDQAFGTGGAGTWLVDTSWSGRKLSWYSTDVYQQLNEKYRTYKYFALLG